MLVNYYTLDHVGPITISGETSPEKLKAAVAAMYEEIGKFDQPGYFTEAELEPQKQQRAVGTAMGLERASGFSHELGFWWSVADSTTTWDTWTTSRKRTTADLRAYAAEYIVGRPARGRHADLGRARDAIHARRCRRLGDATQPPREARVVRRIVCTFAAAAAFASSGAAQLSPPRPGHAAPAGSRFDAGTDTVAFDTGGVHMILRQRIRANDVITMNPICRGTQLVTEANAGSTVPLLALRARHRALHGDELGGRSRRSAAG